jgi:hypothetical protein
MDNAANRERVPRPGSLNLTHQAMRPITVSSTVHTVHTSVHVNYIALDLVETAAMFR